MPNEEWTIGLEIRFYSAWIGIPIVISLLYPLTKQLLIQTNRYKQMRSDEPDHESDETQNDYSDDANLHRELAPFMLLFYAYGSIICVIIHLIFNALFASDSKRLNIKMNDDFCFVVYLFTYHTYIGSLYFFFMFMLYRIRVVFIEPESVKMSTNLYIIMFLLIHSLLIFCLIWYWVSGFWCSPIWSDELNVCSFILDPNIVRMLLLILYLTSTIIITLLSFVFTKRICLLTGQNKAVNNLIKRTIIFGLLASITSLFISIGELAGFETIYFNHVDEIVNCCCIVFSYKIEFTPCLLKWKETNNNDNNDEDITIQPRDSVVMREIFGCDSDLLP